MPRPAGGRGSRNAGYNPQENVETPPYILLRQSMMRTVTTCNICKSVMRYRKLKDGVAVFLSKPLMGLKRKSGTRRADT